MPIPLLDYPPLSQNHRVEGFEIPGDEQPRIYTTHNLLTTSDLDMLIMAAYRQICNEQQMLKHHRQLLLESQLRVGQITVKDFIRGLVLSDSFRRLIYESNSNYRIVEICTQRLLGRQVYNDREKLAWSVVLATKGLQGFVDELLNSEEYMSNFGDSTVPYQRRRILPQRIAGDVTFAHTARYGSDYRNRLSHAIPTPTGLFEQFEQFDLETFNTRANWVNTFSLLSGLAILIVLLLFLTGTNSLLGG